MSDDGLRHLLDLEAIRDLARRYAHCVWQEDVDGAAALFAPDGVMRTGSDRAALEGREAIRTAYAQMIPGAGLQPFVHNHVIDLTGDRATGTCYLDLRANMGGQPMIGSGVYEDVYVRTDEGWRFASRDLTMRFLVPVTEGWPVPAATEG